MGIKEIIANALYKVQVIHSLPGRLRLHIPYIKKIPTEWQLEENYFTVAQRIKGINKVEVCYKTANALVLYDNQKLSPEDVVKLFKDMAIVGMKHKDEFLNYSPEQKNQAILHFVKIMDSHFELESEDLGKEV